MVGFIVTWDVDSRDGSVCARLRRFVHGKTVAKNGKVYRYHGFVEREGVRYLGQSVLFVVSERLLEIREFLRAHRVSHAAMHASIGPLLLN